MTDFPYKVTDLRLAENSLEFRILVTDDQIHLSNKILRRDTMQMRRRNLLKSGLLGAAAATAVAATPASAKLVDEKRRKKEKYDVVVVGAGFAGLCAALEAKE